MNSGHKLSSELDSFSRRFHEILRWRQKKTLWSLLKEKHVYWWCEASDWSVKSVQWCHVQIHFIHNISCVQQHHQWSPHPLLSGSLQCDWTFVYEFTKWWSSAVCSEKQQQTNINTNMKLTFTTFSPDRCQRRLKTWWRAARASEDKHTGQSHVQRNNNNNKWKQVLTTAVWVTADLCAVQKHHSNQLSVTMETQLMKNYTESDSCLTWLLTIWVYTTQLWFQQHKHKVQHRAAEWTWSGLCGGESWFQRRCRRTEHLLCDPGTLLLWRTEDLRRQLRYCWT